MTRADVVVVGAGTSGATLASRLSDDPDRSVVLLEAGPDFPNEAVELDVYPVARLVNDVRRDGPELIVPLAEPVQPTVGL